MTRKSILATSLFTLFLTLISACGGGMTPTQDITAPLPTPERTTPIPEFQIWIVLSEHASDVRALVDGYQFPAGLAVSMTVSENMNDLLPALQSDSPPDLLVLENSGMAGYLATQGMVSDLQSFVGTAGINLNEVFPGPLNVCRENNFLYCLPWNADFRVLLWNKDLFSEAGLDPETPPESLEVLTDYADKLTKFGLEGQVEQVGFLPDSDGSHTALYARLFGGHWYGDNGTQLTVNSQPVVDALLWQQQFYFKYGYENVTALLPDSAGLDSAVHPFYSGKVAMVVAGQSQASPAFIAARAPGLNYGVAPFPPPAEYPDRAGTVIMDGMALAIPANAPNREIAAALVAWLMSADVMDAAASATDGLPVIQGAGLRENPNSETFLQLLNSPNTYPVVMAPLSPELSAALAQVEDLVLHQGAEPQPLLDQVQTQFEPEFRDTLR